MQTFIIEGLKLLATVLAGGAGYFGGQWWMKKFVTDTKTEIKSQNEKLHALHTQLVRTATSVNSIEKTTTKFSGALDKIQDDIRGQAKDIGRLEATTEMAWKTIERIGGDHVKKRLSDG